MHVISRQLRQNQESSSVWFQIRIIFSFNKYDHTNLKMKTDIRISLDCWKKECTISNLASSDPLPNFVKVDCTGSFSSYHVLCKLVKISQVYIYHIHRYPHQYNSLYVSKTILYSLVLMFSSILVSYQMSFPRYLSHARPMHVLQLWKILPRLNFQESRSHSPDLCPYMPISSFLLVVSATLNL